MPSKKNPGDIGTGVGTPSHDAENWDLTGNPVGEIDEAAPSHPEAEHDHGIGDGGAAGLEAHVNTPTGAHPASAISIDGYPAEVFSHEDVETAIDELTGLIPPKPPQVGFFREFMSVWGIPDWGILKLADSPLPWRDAASFDHTSNAPAAIYPYYWQPPHPAQVYKPFMPEGTILDFDYTVNGEDWSEAGGDPISDPMFNIDDFRPGPLYPGGGPGETFAGAFTRDTGGPPDPYIKTMRTYFLGTAGTEIPTVISGMAYPSDRGVLALLHWPAGGDITAFLAQNLDEQVVAALLMGQGILGASNCADGTPCDGDPGGIFLLGTDANGNYDPYQWPGQATGQGSLFELYSAVRQDQTPSGVAEPPDNITDFDPFDTASPYYNFDAGPTTGPFVITNIQPDTPALGQVTITCGAGHPLTLWDVATIVGNTSTPPISGDYVVIAAAGNDFVIAETAPTVTVVDGNAFWVAGVHATDYPDVDEMPFPGQVRLGTDPTAGVTPIAGGIPVLGAWNKARGGGHIDNFFRYRVPYLDNYDWDDLTGAALKWTPNAEKPRYFTKPQLSQGMDASTPVTTLEQAGNYEDFAKDYWPWQVGRFRHQFDALCGACGVAPVDTGSLLLIHFKKEQYFEEMTVDGTMPTADKVYSAVLYDYSDPEDLLNLANNVTPTGVRESYHTIRASLFADDDDGLVVPTFTGPSTFDYNDSTAGAFALMPVSGVDYFIPVDAVGVSAFQITDIDTSATGLFDHTYKVADTQGQFLNMPNPAFLSATPFCWNTNVPSFLAPSVGLARRQRVEFVLGDLGAFTPVAAPQPGDPAVIQVRTLNVQGDVFECSFSQDAKMRAFLRRPLGHDTVAQAIMPTTGEILLPTDGNDILFHSTNQFLSPEFGNFQVGGGPGTPAVPSVQTPRKDAGEWFLDEVYRWDGDWNGLPTYEQSLLVGPGLPLSAPLTPIEVPVRSGVVVDFVTFLWTQDSWIQEDEHTVALKGLEAQVAGLPDRTPPLDEGSTTPLPGRGVVIYPKTNYTIATVRPDAGDGATLRDYSGTKSTVRYVRCLDAARSRWTGNEIKADGQPFVTLRIYGVNLEDFQYAAPGPGGPDLAIFVKVPGLTTWMDLGRADGGGPSKQDSSVDGAGCRIVSDSFSGTDPVTGVAYAQVKVNVGPAVNLFTTVLDGQARGEVPVLVKVEFKDTAEARFYDFQFKKLGVGSWDVASPNYKSGEVRGVAGIHIVGPDDSPPDNWPTGEESAWANTDTPTPP